MEHIIRKYLSDSAETREQKTTTLTRRKFIKLSGMTGAAFTLGFSVAGCDDNATQSVDENVLSSEQLFEPNAFIQIHPDNRITFLIKHLDMGQGAFTGLSTLLAEELDADWDNIQPEHAPNNAEKYAHIGWGGAQGTGGSGGLRDAFVQMRYAGAVAKKMLMQAAALHWNIDFAQLSTEKSHVINTNTGEKIAYGALADLASKMDVPGEETITLKSPEAFQFIGKQVSRQDKGKESGKAIYTQDIQLPNMLTAVVLHPPKFGAKLKSFDSSNAMKIAGVKKIFEVPTGVAVVADNFWLAKTGRDALVVEWDESSADKNSSATLMASYKEIANTPGDVAFSEGDVNRQRESNALDVEMEFEFPYLAHAAMEPMNCVTLVENDHCEIWSGIQSQTSATMIAAGILGMDASQVKINTLFAGGSFGRRGNIIMDYVQESVHVSKAFIGTPVKLVWDRETDTRAGWFRPMYYQKVRAGVNAENQINTWEQTIVGQSITLNTVMASWGIKDNVDRTTVDGLEDLQYQVASRHIDTHNTNHLVQVPVLWWRSVGHTHNAISKEVIIDRLAREAKVDAYEFRMQHLDPESREAKVLTLAVKNSDWGKPIEEGRGRGLALHKSFGTYVAQVAEVSLDGSGGYHVDHVVCAVDCGVPVNPSVIEAQMQGGIGYGLSAILASENTLENGAVKESNFHDYQVLRMNQMPKIDVLITPSTEAPTGVGEPSTCVIGPAVVSALADATGQYFTSFPIKQVS